MSDTTTGTATSSIPGLVAGTYALDTAHSEVGFTVRHLMTKVRGTFQEFSGEIVVKDSIEESTTNVAIELASVSSGDQARDDHLRSADFFDVGRFPTATFRSTGVDRFGASADLAGELTIKDVTKPIELAVEFLGVDQNAYGQTIIGFEASASISRKEWGIDFNVPLEGGKLLIGDKVDIHLDVQAALQA